MTMPIISEVDSPVKLSPLVGDLSFALHFAALGFTDHRPGNRISTGLDIRNRAIALLTGIVVLGDHIFFGDALGKSLWRNRHALCIFTFVVISHMPSFKSTPEPA